MNINSPHSSRKIYKNVEKGFLFMFILYKKVRFAKVIRALVAFTNNTQKEYIIKIDFEG